VPEMLIGGEWRQASAHEEIEVVNPATEEVVDSVPAGAAAPDVELAVATAKRAFAEPKLRISPVHTRAGHDELLERIEGGVSSGGKLLVGGRTGASDKGYSMFRSKDASKGLNAFVEKRAPAFVGA